MEADPDHSFLLTSLLLLAALPWWLQVLISIFFIAILLFCSALVSGSEIAFFSLSHNELSQLEQENSSTGKKIIQLKEKPRRLLATILISNNFINILIVLLSEFTLRQTLPEYLFQQPAAAVADLLAGINLGIDRSALALFFHWLVTVLLVTFLLVLFGEVAPKRYARLYNLKLARLMVRPLSWLMGIFYPLSSILVNSTSMLESRLLRVSTNSNLASREDIDDAIELTVSLDEESEKEADILKRIVKFGEVSVKQIMCSRLDITALEIKTDFNALLELVKESGFSRIPVYEEDLDRVVGILYVKDLLGHLHEGPDFAWQHLVQKNVLYTPEAKKIDDLLREFQSKHLHMAIVVDEYGGTSGLVTLEDILEEVIGDIQDEFDLEPEVGYTQLDDHTFLFEGKTLLNDVARILERDPVIFDQWRGDADSLAGLILELRGRIPKKGAEITVNGFVLKVTSVNERRIEQVQLTLKN